MTFAHHRYFSIRLGVIALLCAAALALLASCGGGSSPAVKEFDIDIDTTWQEVFDSLSASEQECIRGDMDEEALESALEQTLAASTEEWDASVIQCAAPETVRGLYFSAMVMGVEMDPELGGLSRNEKSCLRDWIGGLDPDTFAAANEDVDSAQILLNFGMFACVPDLFVAFVAQEEGVGVDDIPDGEKSCLREWIRDLDIAAYAAAVEDDSAAFFETLSEVLACVPSLTDSGTQQDNAEDLAAEAAPPPTAPPATASPVPTAPPPTAPPATASPVPTAPPPTAPPATASPTPTATPEPPAIPPSAFTDIAASQWHSCALTDQGQAVCWGDNGYGQADPPAGRFTAITAGWYNSCALTAEGAIVCWGADWTGITVAPGGRFTDIDSDRDHSCAIKTDGSAVCWGDNSYGQRDAPSGQFTAVAVGDGWQAHSCALTTEGAAVCWGDNSDGQTEAPSGEFTAIAAGRDLTCAIDTGGSIVCWGEDIYGRGDAPSGRFTDVASSGSHSCAIDTDGYVTCWGSNQNGQAAAPPDQFTAISTGDRHSCGITAEGAAVCWGGNDDGQANAPTLEDLIAAQASSPSGSGDGQASGPTASSNLGEIVLELEILDRSDDSITIDWEAAWGERFTDEVDYYQLSRRTQETRRTLLESQPVGPPYTDRGLDPDTVYYYIIQPCNDSGCGTESEETAGLTESRGSVDVPPTPTRVRGLKFNVPLQSDDAGIEWKTVETATYYEVFQDTNFDAEVSAPGTSYRDYRPNTSIGSFTTTRYKVRACNKAGCSPFSEVVRVD